MKFIYTVLSSLMIVSLFFSCEKEEGIFKGPYHVRFTDTLLTVKESASEQIKISVHNAGPLLDEKITVKYTVQGTAREGVDYKFISKKGEVVIPAQSSFGYIDLSLINNANNIIESQQLTFTITGVTPSNLEIGRSKNGIIGKTFTMIIEDECILTGTYKGISMDDDFPDVRNIKITSLDCYNYTLSNWDIYVTFDFPPDRDLTFIDNGDNTLTIPEQKDDTFDEKFSRIEGKGSVDPLTKQITLIIEHYDYSDTVWVKDQVTFVPQ